MTPRIESYSDATRYLDSFISYEKTLPPKYCGESWYQLDRFRKLLKLNGNPENDLPCIHIAGTDGKGSTAAFIAYLLQSLRYKTGLYTSPHLFDYTERIQINYSPIPKMDFASILSQLAVHLETLSNRDNPETKIFATVFELLTAMAFLYFKKNKVDYAIIETGLGGRLDATNVIDPILSIITPIDREHTRFLGRTIGQIANEKAGIIKTEKPVFLGKQKPAALQSILEKSRTTKSPVYRLTQLAQIRQIQPSVEGYKFHIRSREGHTHEMICPLLGRHQIHNLTLAMIVVQYLIDGTTNQTVSASDNLIRQAKKVLPSFSWPGRSEIIRNGDNIWLLDVAHSPQGAQCLRQLMNELFPYESVDFHLAFSDDKDVANYCKKLVTSSDRIYCHQSSHPRSMPAKKLQEKLLKTGFNQTTIGPNEFTVSKTMKQKTKIRCASGSLFWIADVRSQIVDH